MTQNNSSAPNSETQEVIPTFKIKKLLEWQAPGRVFKEHGREYWTTILAIAGLISIILIFIKEYFLILAIFALIFLYYVLSTRPPEEIEYKVTNRGVNWGNKKYPWEALAYFWFEEKDDKSILNIDTNLSLPGRLIMPLGEQDKEEVQEIMEDFLPYNKPEPNFIEKATNWLAKTFPIEDSS